MRQAPTLEPFLRLRGWRQPEGGSFVNRQYRIFYYEPVGA